MNLERFFSPRAIAVIGVSRSTQKLGSRIFLNLRDGGFHGRLIPVNPSLKRFSGVRVFPAVGRIPGRVDLAIIVTPAPTVPAIVRECGSAGIKHCVVISAGFREIGKEGAAREQELQSIISRYRMNLLGPNCLGFTHGDFAVNASFGQPLEKGGNIALISQSGAMAVALTDWARQSDVTFRAIVSLGNKTGLSEVEMLKYFGDDPKTSAILLYLESAEQGEAFLAAARRIIRRKPVIVLKAGESEIGKRAARSHTGALASSREVFSAALASAGMLQVKSIHELSSAATLFSNAHPMDGNRVAIVTNAGGPAIMATDAISETALTLAAFSKETIVLLKKRLPEAASIANPVDCVGDADERRYERALDAVAADPNVDAVLVLLTPQVVTRSSATAKAVIRCSKRYPKKPFIASFLGGNSVRQSRRMLFAAGIPHYAYPEDAVRAFEMLWSYHRGIRTAHPAIKTAVIRNRIRTAGLLMPPAAHAVLRPYGFRVVQERLVQTESEVFRAGREYGYPLVLKIIRKNLVHKAKGGGVFVGIASPKELRKTLGTMFRRFGRRFHAREGVLVQQMIHNRAEWFVGGKRDASFGPVILLGLGGTDVEQNKNVRTLVPPFSDAEVRTLVRALSPEEGIDVAAIIGSVRGVERLLRENPMVRELDLNPLFVGKTGKGAIVVDARLLVAPQ